MRGSARQRLHVLITRNSITQKPKVFADNLSAWKPHKKSQKYNKENSQNEQIWKISATAFCFSWFLNENSWAFQLHFLENSLSRDEARKCAKKIIHSAHVCVGVCVFVKVNIQLYSLSCRNVCNLFMSCRKFRCQSKSRVKSTSFAMHRWRLTIPLLPLP